MDTHPISQLPIRQHLRLNKERSLLHVAMVKHNFNVVSNRIMRYGFILHFFYNGEEGWLMVYKNKENRTTLSFSFIESTCVIKELIRGVRVHKVATGTYHLTIPDGNKRARIRWFMLTRLKKKGVS